MDGIYVYKVSIARRLVKMGYQIIDLKPAKTSDDKLDFHRTIYVFEDKPEVTKALDVLRRIDVDKKNR